MVTCWRGPYRWWRTYSATLNVRLSRELEPKKVSWCPYYQGLENFDFSKNGHLSGYQYPDLRHNLEVVERVHVACYRSCGGVPDTQSVRFGIWASWKWFIRSNTSILLTMSYNIDDTQINQPVGTVTTVIVIFVGFRPLRGAWFEDGCCYVETRNYRRRNFQGREAGPRRARSVHVLTVSRVLKSFQEHQSGKEIEAPHE